MFDEQKSAPQQWRAEDLRQLILRYGKSVDSVAEALEVHPQVVEDWCNNIGIPESHYAVNLSRELGCSLKEVYLAIICTRDP